VNSGQRVTSTTFSAMMQVVFVELGEPRHVPHRRARTDECRIVDLGT
jgi:hypothetical protein